MASAYAKFTGELGVCIATSGPGASHLITGLYDARLDHMPVLAIAGQQARNALGGHYQQESTSPRMFKDVAGAFVQQASSPAQVRHLVDRADPDRARRAARHGDHPAQRPAGHPYEEPPRQHGTVHSGVGYRAAQDVPHEADLRARRRGAQRGQESRHAGRRRRARRDRRGDRGRGQARRRRAPRRCSARPRCPTICPGSRARSACSAPSRATS